jgi:hypothetical protein
LVQNHTPDFDSNQRRIPARGTIGRQTVRLILPQPLQALADVVTVRGFNGPAAACGESYHFVAYLSFDTGAGNGER